MIHRISGLLMPESIEDCMNIKCYDCAFGLSESGRTSIRPHKKACDYIWGEA